MMHRYSHIIPSYLFIYNEILSKMIFEMLDNTILFMNDATVVLVLLTCIC